MRRLVFSFVLASSLGAITFAAQQSQAPTTTVASAAARGDRDAVRTLLKQGADASAPQGDGMTALHWAADRGDSAMADMLIYAGANVSAVTRIGQYTPLHLAARSGSAGVVQSLLKAGANLNAKTNPGGVTPLHLAAASGSVQAVTMLLDKGADVNVREGEYEQTPLIFAASLDRVEVVKLLIARHADVKATSKIVDITKQQALDRQATALERSIIAASVPKGMEPTPSQQQAAVQAARELFLTGKAPEPPASANAAAAGGGRGGGRGGGGGAAFAGGGAPVRGGAGANANDPATGINGGGTGAADTSNQGRNNSTLNEEGPAPIINGKGGMSALHHAARQGYVRTVNALIDGGADVNQKTADGNSPLLVAVINGEFDSAMALIERGANVNQAAEGLGVTPLWATVNAQWQPRTRFPQPQEMDLQKSTYLDVMKALLDRGADPNTRVKVHPWYMVYTGCGNGNCGLSSMVGSTPFWRAAYGTDVDAMKLLVKYGADPNIPTMNARAAAAGGRGGGAGRGGGGGAGGAGGGGGGLTDDPTAGQATGADGSGLPPVPAGGPAVFPIHAASGVEYGEGYAGNSHRHAPDGWLPAVKYLVEELGADVNARDDGGYTPLHHAAARGDNELILYLVSKGADVKAVSRRNQTTADMANGPVSRISPIPETVALLEKLGSKNNHKCASCAPLP